MDLFLDASDFEMISADFDNDHDRCDLDFDPSFPPMPRERANTWHGPPRTASKDEGVDPAASVVAPSQVPGGSASGAARKATARRNAWGNMSYADLIAKAIESSPEKRLTLAEIYAWLVENVPFFKDKGETNSSAGWKNSIRHNLSLHSRFVRVQNEGAGKSSWWMVNPDKAPSKVPRRRAATMDNSKGMGPKRGRQRRSEPTGTISSTNLSSVDVDASPPSYFPLSPEFRGRVSSNAGSIGRLSPIPATFEIDLDPVVQTTAQSGAASFHQWNNPAAATDMLSDCLAGILMDDIKPSMDVASNLNINSGLTTDSVFLHSGSNNVNFPQNFLASNHYTRQVSPVDILGTTLQKAETFSMSPLAKVRLGNPSTLPNTSMLCVGGNMSGNCGYGSTGLQLNFQQQLYKTPSVNDLLPNARTQLHPSPLIFGETKPSFSTAQCASDTNNSLLTTIPTSRQELPQLTGWPGQTASEWSDTKSLGTEPQTRQRSFTFSSGKLDQNLVKQLLIAKPLLRSDIQKLLQMKRQQLFAVERTKPSSCVTSQTASPVQPSEFVEQTRQSMLEQLLTAELMEQSGTPQLTETLGPMETKMDVTPVNLVNDAAVVFANESGDLPSDLDLSYLNNESAADIECNIDQVIQHELTFGDELDFAFDPIQPNWNKGKAGANEDSLTNFLSY